MKLYDHQQKIVGADPKKSGLFLGTGSGKTRIALLLAVGTTLVIAPKTQCEDQNWQRELKKLGRSNTRITKLVIISKETFRRDWQKLGLFNTVIVDEAHTCLGVTPNTRVRKGIRIPLTSQLFEALESYNEKKKPERLYLCTATIVRNPMTVWGAAKVLGHKIDWFKFREEFYVRIAIPHREVYIPRSEEKMKLKLAKLVHKIGYVGRLEDYFDVPAQTYKTDYIELTPKQKTRIKQMPIEYPEPLACLTKKHQIENGILNGDEFTSGEVFSNGKMDKILDYAVEFPRIVIFAKYRAQIAEIAASLTETGKNVITLTGATKERGEALKRAQSLKQCAFICQAQISAGWELKEYPTMIFASRTNSFVDYSQALGRIQRADNIKKNLYITLIAKGGVDEAQDAALKNKCDFDEKLYLKKK